jgi:hypothetical protein
VSEDLAKDLVERWRNAVDEDAAANPVEGDRYLAYGSTVLAAVASADSLFLLQLGDGDILIVSDDGEVRRPWPPDNRFLGGETLSLCGEEAWSHVRMVCQPLLPGAQQLVVLSTDGYANSFREDEGFLRIGRDILEIILQDGVERVRRDLEHWLHEASELGSGDDITAGILWRLNQQGGPNGG